jgi:hypothetical protein
MSPSQGSAPAPLSDRDRQTHERALRHALWLALVHADALGMPSLKHQLTTILIDVKKLQQYEGPA